MKYHAMRHFIAVAYILLTHLGMASIISIPANVEKATLDENWKEVVDLCSDDKALESSSIIRMLKGHGCLALNHNNESLKLFLSVESENDRNVWLEWTTNFIADNQDNHVAHYLKGDALARLERWEEAIACYTAAVGLEKEFVLSLNARGVASIYLCNYSDALEDFEQANQFQSDFADAYANYGTMLILKRAATGAIEKLQLATEKSSSFALASNALGCARLGKSRDDETLDLALADFAVAIDCAETKELAGANLNELRSLYIETNEKENDSETTKGTTLKARDLYNIQSTLGAQAAENAYKSQPPSIQNAITREAQWNSKWCGAWALFSGNKNSTSYGGGGEIAGLGGINGNMAIDNDPSGIYSTSMSDRNHWNQVAALGKVDSSGNLNNPGGGDTEGTALERSVGDTGSWPVKNTHFSLFPHMPLPDSKSD